MTPQSAVGDHALDPKMMEHDGNDHPVMERRQVRINEASKQRGSDDKNLIEIALAMHSCV